MLSVVPKLVKPVCEQKENESRRLWRDVTLALRNNDIDKATAAKHANEERQRSEGKARAAEDIAWVPSVSRLLRAGQGYWSEMLGEWGKFHSTCSQHRDRNSVFFKKNPMLTIGQLRAITADCKVLIEFQFNFISSNFNRFSISNRKVNLGSTKNPWPSQNSQEP